MALIVDTGPIFALLDRSDSGHARCRDLLLSSDEPLVIPATVIVEVDQLVFSRGRSEAFVDFLADILEGAYVIENLALADYQRVRELLQRYADMALGFVDASVVAIAERLNEPKIATLDHRHFRAIRPRHVEAFELLPR